MGLVVLSGMRALQLFSVELSVLIVRLISQPKDSRVTFRSLLALTVYARLKLSLGSSTRLKEIGFPSGRGGALGTFASRDWLTLD